MKYSLHHQVGQPLDANVVPVLPVHLPPKRDFALWESLRGRELVETRAARGEEAYSDSQKPARRERGELQQFFLPRLFFHRDFFLGDIFCLVVFFDRDIFLRWVQTSWLQSTFPCSATTTSRNWKKFTKKILKCLVILGLSNKCKSELI